MQHEKGCLDFKQEQLSKEPRTLCQNQNSDTNKHALLLDMVSPAIEQEPCDLPQRQISDNTHDVSETHEEGSMLSCENETKKDSDMPMQKPNSNPGVPAQESNSPPVSCLMRDSLKIPNDEPADSQLRRSCESGVKTSAACDGSSVKREMVQGILLPVQGLEGASASQSDEQNLTESTQPEETLEKLQPKWNPDGGGCSSQSDQVTIPSSVSEKISSAPNEEPQPCQENYMYSTKFERVEKLQPRRNPDPVVQESQSGDESTPSKVPDRGLYDGYNWRKYGQKLVKGNKFIRSYYKCTFPNCQARKQVERAHDGCKTDINYLGNHYHEKTLQSSLASTIQEKITKMDIESASKAIAEPIIDHGGANQLVGPTESSPQLAVTRSGDGMTGPVPQLNNDNEKKDGGPDCKRQKREITCADDHVANTSNSHLRHVVQTLSEVDLVNDGYRWRKYGQKLVKGNPNPRSYYRCSYAGCPVKKHVERAFHDPKLVITTYEGKHEHDMPTSRSVARADANMMTSNGESSSKPEENTPVSHEMAAHVNAN